MTAKMTSRHLMLPTHCALASPLSAAAPAEPQPPQSVTYESDDLPPGTIVPGMHCSDRPLAGRRGLGERRPLCLLTGVPAGSSAVALFSARDSVLPGCRTAARFGAPPPPQESLAQHSAPDFPSGFRAWSFLSDGMKGVGILARKDPAAAPEAPRPGWWWRR